MTTLHITNGDSVAGMLKELSDDPVLPWRDVLHDGPVPGGIDAAELGEVRAQFLAERGWTSVDIVRADIAGRDAQMAAMRAGDAVVLWFEPDLYDQLQLLQILARFYVRPAADRPTITIVSADELLGSLAKLDLAKYIDQQRIVREADLELAAQAWEAFTSSDDALLRQFVDADNTLLSGTSYKKDDAVVLPYVRAAMRRLLQEYPSDTNGLSRTEQQIADVLLRGSRKMSDAYQQSHAPKEEWTWLGDWGFAWYVERLMQGALPLIEFETDGGDESGNRLADGFARRIQRDGATLWNRKIRLTETGKAVANGERNAVLLNGIDRWIGGAHLVERAVS